MESYASFETPAINISALGVNIKMVAPLTLNESLVTNQSSKSSKTR